jgi:hypothetical protein
MKLFVRFAVWIVPLLALVGCDSKPKPADVPKNQMELPKTRPMPAGGGNKAPQTSQNYLRTPDAERSLA